MSPTQPRHVVRAAILAFAVLAAACSTSTAGGSSGGPTPTPTETATPTGDGPIAVDLEPGGDSVTLDNGWTVQHCEGDAPLLCVHGTDGEVLGTVEFGSYPATDEIAQALAEGTVVEALEDRVADQHASIADDRARGCGDGYEYRPEPVTDATVGGEPAVVYAFSGVVDGREIERHRAYYTVHAGQIWIVNAAASDPEGCMATEFQEFLPADLVTFEPYLERIVAGMQLPEAGTALTEGMVVGVDGGLDGGLVYVLWGGGKQRIQQPATMTEADLDERGLHREAAIANVTVVEGQSGSYFVVVPPDGDDARLHLVVDGIVREVLVQHVRADLLEGTPDLDEQILDRLRPARSAAG